MTPEETWIRIQNNLNTIIELQAKHETQIADILAVQAEHGTQIGNILTATERTLAVVDKLIVIAQNHEERLDRIDGGDKP